MELLLENTLYSNQQGNTLVATVPLTYQFTLVFVSFLIPFLHHRCFLVLQRIQLIINTQF